MNATRKLAGTLLVLALGVSGFVSVAGRAEEPDVVRVQHVLIGFKGSVRAKEITRTKEEAKALAAEILALAQKPGEDFDALVKQHTDDRYPGVYLMTNTDTPIRGDAFKRTDMVSAFGDVAFSLAVGEVGMTKHNPQTSPFGWHIIKRLE